LWTILLLMWKLVIKKPLNESKPSPNALKLRQSSKKVELLFILKNLSILIKLVTI
jgi:hypothetical protein